MSLGKLAKISIIIYTILVIVILILFDMNIIWKWGNPNGKKEKEK
jgi:hypothetical protein